MKKIVTLSKRMFSILLIISLVLVSASVSAYSNSPGISDEDSLFELIDAMEEGDELAVQLEKDITLTKPLILTDYKSLNIAFNEYKVVTNSGILIQNCSSLNMQNGFLFRGELYKGSLIQLDNFSSIGLDKLLLDGMGTSSDGPLIHSQGSVMLTDCTLQNNVNSGNGGAILMEGGDSSLKIRGSSVINNTAENGGGIFYQAAEISNDIQDTTFENNISLSDCYSLSYDANGGSNAPVDSSSYLLNSTAIIKSGKDMTAPAGKSFYSWNTRADGKGTDHQPGDKLTVTGNITLYAKWSAIPTYSIVYDANGGGNAPVDSSSYFMNSTAIIKADTGMAAPAGKSFYAWNTKADGKGTDHHPGDKLTVTGNITLYAKWSVIPTYTIVYDANGGSNAPVDSSSYLLNSTAIIKSGKDMTAPAGKIFDGWNSRADGNGTDHQPGKNLTITGNITLYAKWSVIPTYTIVYDANGGGNAPVDSSCYFMNSTAIIKADTGMAAPAGKRFYSWNTRADGTGADHQPGKNLTITGNITLYAKWSVIPTYSIVYDANGGSNAPVDSSSYFMNSTASLKADTGMAAPAGKRFYSWNTRADGKGADHQPGDKLTVTDNITLYAKWSAIPTYTIVYDANGGSNAPKDNIRYEENSIAAIKSSRNMTAPAGKIFDGWNSRADGSGTEFYEGQELPMTENLILYAKWKILPVTQTYNISYDSNGGDGAVIDSLHYELHDIAIVKPYSSITPAPDMCCTGWNSKADGSGKDYEAGDNLTVTANIVLYAQWKKLPAFQLIYNANGGGNPPVDEYSYLQNSTATVKDGSAMTSPTGKSFAAWNSRADGSGVSYQPGVAISMSENITLYAQWQSIAVVDEFYIRYDANGGKNPPSDKTAYHSGDKVILKSATAMTAPKGKIFKAWSLSAEGSGPIYSPGAKLTVENSICFYAIWQPVVLTPDKPAPRLDTAADIAYINGYDDGTVRPGSNISREEATTIFYRLLNLESSQFYQNAVNDFTDVSAGRWSNQAISTIFNAGAITGYPEGIFAPGKSMTRAEFITIAIRLLNCPEALSSNFPDISGHWARENIDKAASMGLIKGDKNGNFRPDSNITRAEVCAIVNRILGRSPSQLPADLENFSDNLNPNLWYYNDIRLASTSFKKN